jgi:imidazolonepropionase-like amidohydrolase
LKARLIVFGILAGPWASGSQQPVPASYIINDVTVIDVAAGRAMAAQRVVITGSRISAVGSAASAPAPAGATVVSGTGKFLIPGLWDMHVHASTAAPDDNQLVLFLANGITGIRDMGSGLENSLRWRASVAEGRVPGPRIVAAGVLVDGAPIVYPAAITFTATTADEARRAVDSLAARGVDFIKAYEMLRPEVYSALAARAKARGLPHAGHLPLTVSAEDAVRAGHKSFEHLRNMEVACSSKADSLRAVAAEMLERGKDQPGMRLRSTIHAATHPRAHETQDEARCASLIRLMAGAGVWQVPTLVLTTMTHFRHDTTEFFQKWLPYLPAAQRETWRRRAGELAQGPYAQAPAPERARLAQWMLGMVKRMHDAGVRILPGTDFPIAVMIPGAALHEELAIFVKAGLTPAEALRTGTLHPATYLGLADSLGTVEPGKLAELVLLDANPLEDIRYVARVQAVWRGGRYLDRGALDAMLDRLRR